MTGTLPTATQPVAAFPPFPVRPEAVTPEAAAPLDVPTPAVPGAGAAEPARPVLPAGPAGPALPVRSGFPQPRAVAPGGESLSSPPTATPVPARPDPSRAAPFRPGGVPVRRPDVSDRATAGSQGLTGAPAADGRDPALPVLPAGPTEGLSGQPVRLRQALQAAIEQDGHGQPLAPAAQATLARLMGTSVADVRVVRNAHVPAALREARAEALTLGRTVFLSPDTRLDTAAGTALAAHELTHALRDDRASFMPEVLRRSGYPARPDAHDEEGVALATEHAAHDESRRSGPDGTRRLPGIPAPWEPLPWETDRAAPPPAGRAVSMPAPPVAGPPPAALPPAAGGGAWLHAAATDRPAPAAAPAVPDRQGANAAVGRRAPVAAPVDLDQVAREVYARLRERLSSELRRV
ncbi:hypothetical protein Ddep01_01877 [Deinococcus depolymerans]|uniref:eCIS core domain-containing protein n=1 Tax=Deinococcus depolymerans TaxID=392408 RepID=UPI0030AADD6A